tara:strand:+ start:864 stop:965 length:102 start_codon:yes stop_codon:yes gene_type:complete
MEPIPTNDLFSKEYEAKIAAGGKNKSLKKAATI